MHFFSRYAVAGAVFMLSLFATAQDRVEASLSADLVSSYIWRGLDMGNAAVQPSLSVGWKGLSLSAFGSLGLVNNTGADYAMREIDFSLEYSVGGFTVGLEDQYEDAEGLKPRFFDFTENGAHLLEAYVAYDFGFMRLGWHVNLSGPADTYINEAGVRKHVHASYCELSAPFTLGGLDWMGTLGVVPYASKGFYNNGSGLTVTNVSLRANKALNISHAFRSNMHAELIANPYSRMLYLVVGFGVAL